MLFEIAITNEKGESVDFRSVFADCTDKARMKIVAREKFTESELDDVEILVRPFVE